METAIGRIQHLLIGMAQTDGESGSLGNGVDGIGPQRKLADGEAQIISLFLNRCLERGHQLMSTVERVPARLTRRGVGMLGHALDLDAIPVDSLDSTDNPHRFA